MPYAAMNGADRHGEQQNDAGDFLTDQQLAEMLGVTPRTTLRWRRDGNGPPFVRAGLRRVLYQRTAVLNWAASHTYPHLAAEAQQKMAA